jgi:predicted nucleotide-binding protein
MRKAEAFTFIREQINESVQVVEAGPQSPAFTRWHRDTMIVLGRIFGEDHQNLEDFARVRFDVGVIRSGTTPEHRRRAFVRGVEEARAVLESMGREIERFWPEVSEVVPAQAMPPRQPGEASPVATASGDAKPRLFIGSSSEGLRVAEAAQAMLHLEIECTVWTQGVFKLSTAAIESLEGQLEASDFALLVVTPDDTGRSRGTEHPIPRDNVIFELGLFMGALGRDKTFLLKPTAPDLKLPSDIAGVVVATYDANRSDGNLRAALGPACTEIKDAIRERHSGVSTNRRRTLMAELEPRHLKVLRGLEEHVPKLVAGSEIEFLAARELAIIDMTPHAEGHGFRYRRTPLGTELLARHR